jgi:hypothetical protein
MPLRQEEELFVAARENYARNFMRNFSQAIGERRRGHLINFFALASLIINPVNNTISASAGAAFITVFLTVSVER